MHKYKIDEEVFTMRNNKIISDSITGILKRGDTFNYRFSTKTEIGDIDDCIWESEKDIFKTKQELIDSL